MAQPNLALPRRGAAWRFLRLLATAAVAAAAAGCSRDAVIDCTTLDFAALEVPTTRLRVVNRHGEPMRETGRREDIEAVLRFAAARPGGWCRPLYDTPVGWVGIELYAGERLQDTLHVGPNFVGVGNWRIRTLDLAERQDLMRLLAVDDPYAATERR